jgi:hypothetical protein
VDASVPWVIWATVANPTAAGQIVILPRCTQARARIDTITAGTIYALLLRMYR